MNVVDANPSVNRCLRDKAMDNLDHALGRPLYPLRESYRNFFACDDDSARAAAFASSPNWEKSARSGKMAYFAVTETGRRALAGHLSKMLPPTRGFAVTFDGHTAITPATTASKARYDYYLRVSDVMPDLTFGDFCKRTTVRLDQEAASNG